jgi:hypothetical protein
MKKVLIGLVGVFCLLGVVYAAMDDVEVSATSLKTGTTQTNEFVIRGDLAAVKIEALSTESSAVSNTVLITYGDVTLFNRAVTNDTTYPLMYGMYGSTGVALTNGTAPANIVYGRHPVAGKVTVKQTANGAATNNWKTTVIFEK